MGTVAIGMPGGWEWAVIGFFVLLIFGNRIPKVCRGLGSSITEFKKGLRDVDEVKKLAQEQQREIMEAARGGQPDATSAR